jgi:hypothetical protein
MSQSGRKKLKKLEIAHSLLITFLVGLTLLWSYSFSALGKGAKPGRGSSSMQHSKAAASLPQQVQLQASCPKWIEEYAVFHRYLRFNCTYMQSGPVVVSVVC